MVLMWGLPYLLFSASTVAAATLHAGGPPEGFNHVLEIRRPAVGLPGVRSGPGYGGSLVRDDSTGGLVKRQTNSTTITQYCRFWGHSSAVVSDKRLYISGGISTFKENYRNGYLYLFSSAIMIDLSSGVTYPVEGNDPVFSYSALANPNGESTQMGAFWWDGNTHIYKYGGWFADDKTWPSTAQAAVRKAQLWQLDLSGSNGAGLWSQVSLDSSIRRAWGGAVASAPEKKRGFFLGGIVDNTTDIAFADAPGYEVLGDSFLNFDADTKTFQNKTYSTAGASDLGSIALGNLVYIPDVGKEGILVYIGGMNGPAGKWVPKDTTEGVTLIGMDSVWVHDIANNRWYRQKTSLADTAGGYPRPRISACAVVLPSSDKTSWNIFVYGGGDLEPNGSVYGDTWVLSLPSFKWIQVDDNGDARFEHTCHVVKGNQMLVVGGRDKQQDSAGDPAANYGTHPGDWSCLRQGIISSLDLNTLLWDDALPVNNVDYSVNSKIFTVIGGSSTGGATKLEPDNGWDDAALGRIMASTTTDDSDDTKKEDPPSSSSSEKSTNVGAIAGGVAGGVVAIALIAIVFILLRRNKKKKAAAAAARDASAAAGAPQQPPVAQYDPRQSTMYNTTPAPQYWPQGNQQAPPGYVWDPHSGQYYLPVPTPAPPQSPPPLGGYYKPHEEPQPQQSPVGHIAEMEPNAYRAPQELHG